MIHSSHLWNIVHCDRPQSRQVRGLSKGMQQQELTECQRKALLGRQRLASAILLYESCHRSCARVLDSQCALTSRMAWRRCSRGLVSQKMPQFGVSPIFQVNRAQDVKIHVPCTSYHKALVALPWKPTCNQCCRHFEARGVCPNGFELLLYVDLSQTVMQDVYVLRLQTLAPCATAARILIAGKDY